MSHWLTRVSGLCLTTAVLLTSCEKEGDQVTLQQSGTTTVATTASTLMLNDANAASNVTTISWAPASYGYASAPSYVLQFDTKAGNFTSSKMQEVNVGTATSKTFTGAELNALLLQLGLPTTGTSSDVVVRVKTVLSSKVNAPFSAPINMKVTPYKVVINYPSLYVPGNHQGWNPATAPTVGAFNSNNNQLYEGYVNFGAASPEFKFTSVPAWSGTNYGNGNGGKLSTDGGAGNLTVPTTGYYLLKADVGALTWSATKTTWGVIGSATPNGWNSDTPLTYDATTGVWSARVALTVGEIKFRANSDWTINFGDGFNGATPKVAPDGVLDYGGDNLPITTAGTYTVTLDLSKPGNYAYSVK
ncbi:SusE domain-containing protein [Hymenobacter metallilatus]|uniref:SusF/SusE family outer membrane protein n=1 Tax=Hymenobacter metallilatus TaxID=2493666 RepID=A0A3R9P6Y8_9BACT|nr:SusE domain-containing protein [Hymenobacter metallilatus]RSK29535.1 SusF/SusE family outer membrane protein [Hymenobacter metallilatus]